MRAKRLYERLYERVSIFLSFRNVKMKEKEERLVISLSLVAGLRLVDCSGELFKIKRDAYCCKDLARKLYVVFREEIRRLIARYSPMVKK